MNTPAKPRRSPCASCPYRCGVESGIWHPEEYAKLERYDAEMPLQPTAYFTCHQGAGEICSGWLGHRDPADLLAVRIGIIRGDLDPSCADYTTPVPLFGSGVEAAEHGRRDVEHPSEEAQSAIRKIIRVRAGSETGPVTL